jgi:hypothetical protein
MHLIGQPFLPFNRSTFASGTAVDRRFQAERDSERCSHRGIRLIRNNSPAGFSVRITLYGKADKRIADRALTYVEREKRRQFRLDA